jgi:threonine synthase
VYPVGNAGNISAAHKALVEYEDAGLLRRMPRLTGVQATGASPIAKAIAAGRDSVEDEPQPETIATAIRIGRPVSAVKALRAIRATDGTAIAVSDDAITAAQRDLARAGVFCEPASAASVAGLRALAAAGVVDKGEDVVCVLTGHGLKDPAAADRLAARPVRVAARADAILAALSAGPLHARVVAPVAARPAGAV